MTARNVIIFLAGSLTGGAAGVFATKGYFQKLYQERSDAEIEEMQQWYDEKAHEVIRYLDEEAPEVEEYCENDVVAVKAAVEEIQNHKQTTNYAKMYHKSEDLTDEEIEDLEKAVIDGEVSMEQLAREATEDHNRNKNKPPRIISEESLGEIPAYVEHKVLFYYTLDDTITDEEDNIIDDPDYLLGDSLDKFNFRESDEDIIFVRNFAMDVVYEIQKIKSAFEEE